MLDQEKNKSVESLTDLCHLLSVLYSMFCVQPLSSLPRANSLSIFLVRWFFSTWSFFVGFFFFKDVVCSKLYIIEYNTFKEPNCTVQDCCGWSSVCYSFAGLQAGVVDHSVLYLTHFRAALKENRYFNKKRNGWM